MGPAFYPVYHCFCLVARCIFYCGALRAPHHQKRRPGTRADCLGNRRKRDSWHSYILLSSIVSNHAENNAFSYHHNYVIPSFSLENCFPPGHIPPERKAGVFFFWS